MGLDVFYSFLFKENSDMSREDTEFVCFFFFVSCLWEVVNKLWDCHQSLMSSNVLLCKAHESGQLISVILTRGFPHGTCGRL